MYFNLSLDKTQILQKKIRELNLEVERQNESIANIFTELNLTKEELSSYLKNRENFSSQEWKILEDLRNLLDEKSNLDLSLAYSPSQNNQKIEEQKKVAPHWIFCR